MTPDIVTGLQPWHLEGSIEDQDYFWKNSNGMKKRYPMGPTCTYKGRQVPCCVVCNETDTITSSILLSVLKHIDKYAPLKRSPGNYRFIVLDRHRSRLDEALLIYMNTEETQWIGCIGVPYNTKIWQAGDDENSTDCIQ